MILLFVLMTGTYESKCQPHQIRRIAHDAAWLWFNNENVLLINGTLYIGCEDSLGNAQVVYYNLADTTNYSGISYKLSSWEVRKRRYPTHNYPSIIKTGKRSILAVYHISGNQMFCRTGVIHGDGKPEWSKETAVTIKSGMNYSNLLKSGKRKLLYNFFSIYQKSPSLILSKDRGKSWHDEINFMRQGGTGTSPYMKLCSNDRDRIDLLYTDGHPRTEMRNSIYHLYISKHTFYRTDGRRIASLAELSGNPMLPEKGMLVYNGSFSGPGWVWDIEYDSDESPVAAFITSADSSEGSDLRYNYAKWDSKNARWSARQIAYAGNHLYLPENHFAGGITIDPGNTDIVYISTNVDPGSGIRSFNNHYQIYKGVTKDDGINWVWEQITCDNDCDNLRPVVPKCEKPGICVLWMTQKTNKGKGFNSEIRGITPININK